MTRNMIGSVIGGAAALGLIVVFFGSWYTVDETERGVLLRNGALVGVVDPGLSFKTPFIETVKLISTQSQVSAYENLQAYSKDQQSAQLKVSVSWHVAPSDVAKVYTQFKDIDGVRDRLISRQVPTQVENVFGQFNAVAAVQNRVQLVNDISAAIKKAVAGPVMIDSVQVENIDFSDAYEKAIEARMAAEVQVKTREQQLATEQVQAQIRVTQAQAEADAQLAQAKADAQATELRGRAEAEAIKARAQALASNQNLVELTKAERWNGVLPTTVLPDGAVPFIDARQNRQAE
ncbi:Band 7 protein [Pseudomonas gingeri NCPPB 3146 = LMG 5327]|uniref:Prohibitin family protein n=2 Tax=Pseudomonas gingeri TaxID=117681 RepID=A0A7Y7XUY6_9PSED|nr:MULTISPECIES: SPFH domain-containing protein [Pseudomonas]NVZ29245.1 prohibitin family protein [Pseudomonas gingeri]NWA08918.1 prohibitin family protein [Pseudomonas gingeri]NWC12574.1 prohibitin family protein [Pseudomonas gingeri]NWE48606.1 prohibitin family protein [Pseudomonas gingeri]NWE70637.1 prohibitin family protein [Pseudomonas gingeri]